MENTSKILKIIVITFIIIFLNIQYIYADDVDEEIVEVNQEFTENCINEVAKNISGEPTINSRKAIVYDRKSKRILYGKNEKVKCAMASTTKIMTATVVLENANLSDAVTISAKAGGTGGSRLGLKKGDKITLNDLLYGLMLRSGNDAAVAIAEHVGGSVQGFSDMMNKKAQELGLTDTNFVTPHGLDNSKHYTTAYELAKLTDYALQNEKFAQIVGTKQTSITINGVPRTIANTNELLGVLNGVVGVKTGFTNGAGRCLVTETKRNDKDIITVVLGADTKKDRTRDSIKLIEYTFSNFKNVNVKEKALEEFEKWNAINSKRIVVIKGKESNVKLELNKLENEIIPMKAEQENNIKITINSITQIETPIQKGQKMGTLSIRIDDEVIENVDIVCKEKIEKKNWMDYLKQNLQDIFKIHILNL